MEKLCRLLSTKNEEDINVIFDQYLQNLELGIYFQVFLSIIMYENMKCLGYFIVFMPGFRRLHCI